MNRTVKLIILIAVLLAGFVAINKGCSTSKEVTTQLSPEQVQIMQKTQEMMMRNRSGGGATQQPAQNR